jgi:predicted phosphodiesterase
MKIQLASDLHIEHLERRFPREGKVLPDPRADVLVLAGDIHLGTQGIECYADAAIPVIYVAGNHEFYGAHWERTRAGLKAAAAGTSVHVLDNDRIEIAGVRFLGATLWTDFRQPGFTQCGAMQRTEAALNDFRLIQTDVGPFSARQALADHERSRAWLEGELSQTFEGLTVVVTHHGSHALSIHPRYLGNPVNAGFVSDLEPLVKQANVWVHGHVHDSFNYMVEGCRVIANPRGYPRNLNSARSIDELRFENVAFNEVCLIEV